MTFIYVGLAITTSLLYITRRYLLFLLCYIALMTELFMLDTIGGAIRGSDLCLFINVLLLPIALYRKSRVKSKEKKIDRIVILFLAYILFEFFLTIITGADTISYAMKVVRIPLMFVAYYIFRTISLDTYKRFLKIMLYITIVQGVLFILQFADINLLAGRFDEESFGFAFAINIPTFTYLYIFFCLDAQIVKRQKYILLVLFFAILLLTFVRAFIISALLGVLLYIVMVRGLRKSVAIIVAMLFLIPVALNVIETKSEASGSMRSTQEEIMLLFSGIDNLRQLGGDGGTSVFRIAMLIERVDYLVHNPEYMLFGVGAIHEDSPNCYNRFNFALGTYNEDRYYERCIIESGDITWVPVTLRYGLVGVCIHMSIIVLLITMAMKRKDLMRIFFPLLVIYFIKSFDGAMFESPWPCVELSLYLAMFARCYMEQKELNM